MTQGFRWLARLMHELRAIKSPIEVDLIRQACGITRGGFMRVLEFVRPGVNEAEIEAEFAHEFIRQRARFAYPPIVATGVNACALHYLANSTVCRSNLRQIGLAVTVYVGDFEA